MRLELPERKKLVHESTVPLCRGDRDTMCHRNDTLCLRHLESARLEWLYAFGADAGLVSRAAGMRP